MEGDRKKRMECRRKRGRRKWGRREEEGVGSIEKRK